MSRPGGVKDSFRLTLQKPEISAGSMGHKARKGFSLVFLMWCVLSFPVNTNLIMLTDGEAEDVRLSIADVCS